ncbi:hypothetical protein H4R35_004231 [Dimargaris xerosporica]|nr:hypothetical protein H4R35_004231 [Dimargaris xerosporica]
MGVLFSAFRPTGMESAHANPYADFELDLQAPLHPTDRERFAEAIQILDEVARLTQSLRSYTGSTDAIRKAISNPTAENEEHAWLSLTPSVIILRHFYERSEDLEQMIPQLLDPLCTNQAQSVAENFNQHQSLVKLLARILSLAFEFDALKMANPSIQNDFSYYRRTLHRLKKSTNPQLSDHLIPDGVTNSMSLFYAYPNPMLRLVIDAITVFVTKSDPRAVAEGLAVLNAACYNALNRNSEYHAESSLFFQRVIVTCTILYDHVEPLGVFQRNSSINVRSIVSMLKKCHNQQTENLLNALRYSTKHLNDETTPKQVRILLSA